MSETRVPWTRFGNLFAYNEDTEKITPEKRCHPERSEGPGGKGGAMSCPTSTRPLAHARGDKRGVTPPRCAARRALAPPDHAGEKMSSRAQRGTWGQGRCDVVPHFHQAPRSRSG